MGKYRKKPVIVDAIRWDGSNYHEVCDFVEKPLAMEYSSFPPSERILVIETLEGTVRASAGDIIIRGVKGEFYPCKPDIFEETYEPVD
ncbi:hypothetical protein P4V33_01575 [Brevibacillus borstelensis]|uniref:hypothetical protein n=1 Tax=Brevibacillus borstelensis TaxID=45462 RepID=UPI002E22B20E|nr:hypothetical protein [Brevibacillus borstelensis]